MIAIATLVILFFSLESVLSADSCHQATLIDPSRTAGQFVNGDTSGNTPAPSLCLGDVDDSPGQWFRLRARNTGVVTLDTCASPATNGFDTMIEVYTGHCNDLSCYAASDDGCGHEILRSNIKFLVEKDQLYFILVRGYSDTDSGQFKLRYAFSDKDRALTNDLCQGAQPIALPHNIVKATTDGATDDVLQLEAIDDDLGPGRWYTFVPRASGIFTATTCAKGTITDTVLELYTHDSPNSPSIVACKNMVPVASNDDDAECGINDLASTVSLPVFVNRRYYLLVRSYYASDVGAFQLITRLAAPLLTAKVHAPSSLIRPQASSDSDSADASDYGNDVLITVTVNNGGGSARIDGVDDVTFTDVKVVVYAYVAANTNNPHGVQIHRVSVTAGFVSDFKWNSNTQRWEAVWSLDRVIYSRNPLLRMRARVSADAVPGDKLNVGTDIIEKNHDGDSAAFIEPDVFEIRVVD